MALNLGRSSVDDTPTQRLTPVDVSALTSGVSVIAAGIRTGGFHTCARLMGGAIKCWGFIIIKQGSAQRPKAE
jgi:hypothetical protein